MNDIGRQVFRSGAYALLAAAFVLACSLLMPAEQAGTQMASRFHPADLPALRSGEDGFSAFDL